MKKKYFGTDGIRGKAYQKPIEEKFLSNLASSIIKSNKNISNVLIGMDTRESGEYVKNSLVSGFVKHGVSCDCLEVVSTPILCFYTKNKNYDLGIMISASHNPSDDNGIKIFKADGEKLTDEEEIIIENNISSDKIVDINSQKLSNPYDNLNEYKNFLLEKFSSIKGFNKKIVLDCANGSLSYFAPNFFKKLNFNFINYGCSPDGKNINLKCGALEYEKLSKMTTQNDAQIGISFDGDADRLIVCDHSGNIIDGDFILALLAKYILKKKNFNNSIVSTKMCNLSFRNFMKELGFRLYMTDVGDRYVVEKMKSTGSFLGGEQSGHIIFSDNSFCGDGLLTALYLIKILAEEDLILADICNNLFKKSPQKLVNFKINESIDFLVKSREITDLILMFEEKGCDILLRKSGTENVLRLMVQSYKQSEIYEFLDKFSSIINANETQKI